MNNKAKAKTGEPATVENIISLVEEKMSDRPYLLILIDKEGCAYYQTNRKEVWDSYNDERKAEDLAGRLRDIHRGEQEEEEEETQPTSDELSVIQEAQLQTEVECPSPNWKEWQNLSNAQRAEWTKKRRDLRAKKTKEILARRAQSEFGLVVEEGRLSDNPVAVFGTKDMSEEINAGRPVPACYLEENQ